MTEREQLQYEHKINRLQSQLADVRQTLAEMIVRYKADCTSCKHQGNGMYCNGCPTARDSKYEPVGIDDSKTMIQNLTSGNDD